MSATPRLRIFRGEEESGGGDSEYGYARGVYLYSSIVFQSRHYYAMIINVLLTIDFSMSTEVSSKLGRS